jgi:ADP-ribose pyrophosphatase
MSDERRLLVFERGDAVAALLYDPEEREVIVVDQFRLPTLGKGLGQGWILEPAAGMIREGETPEQCLRREIKEETGYQVTEISPIATFFVSPGGSSERIYLYYADVRRVQRIGNETELGTEGENISLVRMPIDEFNRKLQNREFEDAKLIIAGQWLKDRIAYAHVEVDDKSEPTVEFRIRKTKDKIVGFKVGNILEVKDVDVWVNSENTDMMMDRFFSKSVSATIRFHGAKKFANTDRIEEDTIGEALQAEMGPRNFVEPATVIGTTSGLLARSHNVKRIFHVAAVQGAVAQGLTTNIDTLELCVDRVLERIDTHNENWLSGSLTTYDSVLFPMLATGQGGFFVRDVAPRLVRRAIDFFENRPRTRLKKVYFLAYSWGDKEILEQVMSAATDRLERIRPGPESETR